MKYGAIITLYLVILFSIPVIDMSFNDYLDTTTDDFFTIDTSDSIPIHTHLNSIYPLYIPQQQHKLNAYKPNQITSQAFEFISTWNTSITYGGSSLSNQITLPLVSSGSYNFTVNWGDSSTNNIISYNQAEITHNYTISGLYTITITGEINGWRFYTNSDKLKLLEISQWGPFQLGDTGSYFYGASNLVLTATDVLNLNGTTSFAYAFSGDTNLGNLGSMNSWDVSNITDMTAMFRSADTFDQPIGNWNTSRVTDMTDMFLGADAFNQPIGNWDVSSVTIMDGMFAFASSFNQQIDSWDVGQVTTIQGMFDHALIFNQSLSSWDVSSVKDMTYMFNSASNFNQPLNTWNLSSANSLIGMFSYAVSFNQPLDKWNMSNVTSIWSMFESATAFNQPIGNWNISHITSLVQLFFGASSFNQPIDGWDVSNVTNMQNLFLDAVSFNQPLNSWDTSNVTLMRSAFHNAQSFNQPLDNWNVSSVTDAYGMYGMFYNAKSFDQSLGNWNVSGVTDMGFMLSYSGMSIQNYDNLLISWSNLNLQPNVPFRATGIHYSSNAQQARQYIINTYGWSILDAGLAIFEATPPAISHPVDVSYIFGNANNSISWEVGDVNPGTYNITLDGSLYVSKTKWSANGTVSVNVDGLAVGSHEFTLFVYDLWGNFASDSVLVVVTSSAGNPPPASTSVSQTSTSQATVSSSQSSTENSKGKGSLPISLQWFIFSIMMFVVILRIRTPTDKH